MAGTTLPDAGEDAALRAVARLPGRRARAGYDEAATARTSPGTSALSAHLKYGEIHPRTLLADLAALRTARGRQLPQRAVLAGVLRGRAVAPAGVGARVPAARVRPA